MKIEFGFGFPIIEKQLCYIDKDTKTLSDYNWNGFYKYGSDSVFINLKANDFKLKEQNIIQMLTWTITHESLHSAIYKITNVCANMKEEYIIDSVCKDYIRLIKK